MFTWIVTGAAGHLGGTIVRLLQERKAEVRGLVLPHESAADQGETRYFTGDVTLPETLVPLFEGTDPARTVVIHTAGLIDIGGGSTEIVVGRGMEIQRAVSLQMGAVRLYRCHPIQSVEEAHAAVRVARALIAPERPAFAAIRPPVWVGVGGTFTTTAALVQEIPWNQRSLIHGFSLTQERVLAAMETLAPMPMEKRLAIPSLQPQRADIVVHGVVILLACMQELDLPAITVSEYGNLEGYLKVKYLYGGQA